MSKIKLGVIAKDKITGFQGMVTGKSKWLTGCDQVCLKPSVNKEGKLQDGHWFDVGAVEYVSPGITAEDVRDDKPGGPRADTPKP